MKYAIAAVSAFPRKKQPRAFTVERCSPFDELLDGGRAFFDERVDRFHVAETITGGDRVVLVQLEFVIVAESDSNASLRVFGGGFAQAVFGNDEDAAERSQFNGCAKARNTSSDHYKIGANALMRGGNNHMVQRDHMPLFEVRTRNETYPSVVERGILKRVLGFIPESAGELFVVTTDDVWKLYGNQIQRQFEPKPIRVFFFPGGEVNKRLSAVEKLAEEMVAKGADRMSIVIGFGGGIVTDVSGFLAAIFMRGIPVVQIPTTLLAQVDAAIGGKTGVNLVAGKNLIGSFHQPRAVLIDPDVLATLPLREYRAGLFEVIKCGVIRDPSLFRLLKDRAEEVLAHKPDVVDELIARAVRIKTEIVSADERESDLRRILNFGHTIGHAIEAETGYARFLHGEAIAWGMLAAARLAELIGTLGGADAGEIKQTICRYGPLPSAANLDPKRLIGRLETDKKTVKGNVHFVLPVAIGEAKIVSGVNPTYIRQAIQETLE